MTSLQAAAALKTARNEIHVAPACTMQCIAEVPIAAPGCSCRQLFLCMPISWGAPLCNGQSGLPESNRPSALSAAS